MNKLEKHCIFCGECPVDKTKEHVFPEWLIKMTGNSKRKLSFPHYHLPLKLQF